jgi:hypothetical protein
MRRLHEPDSVFMAVFCIFALLLWLTIIGGGGRLIETLQQDSTWVWPNRLGILAQTVGVLLVIAQLRIILKEQERTTAALLRGPRLRLGVTEATSTGSSVRVAMDDAAPLSVRLRVVLVPGAPAE